MGMRAKVGSLVAMMLLVFLNECYSSQQEEMSVVPQTLEMDLKTLADARVFFGHQSVGKNIIAGIEELLGDQP
jgi:hypothetical protein